MYIEVILPLSTPNNTFTYSINDIDKNKIQIGYQVIVALHTKKIYIGIVESIHNQKTHIYNIKSIIAILGQQPIIHDYQIKIWKFITTYYCCSLGIIYRNTFPSILKLKNYIFISINNTQKINLHYLTQTSKLIIESILKNKIINISKLEKLISSKDLINSLKYLYQQKSIKITRNNILNKKNIISYIKLHEELENNPKKLEVIIKQLEKKKQQKKILITFVDMKNKNLNPIAKKILLKKSNCKNETIKILEKNNILQSYLYNHDKFNHNNKSNTWINKLIQFTEEQKITNNKINNCFQIYNKVLLYGDNISNKISIYIQQILQFVNNNKQVLLLVPEIINIEPIFRETQKIFKNKIGIYHSKLSNNKKAHT